MSGFGVRKRVVLVPLAQNGFSLRELAIRCVKFSVPGELRGKVMQESVTNFFMCRRSDLKAYEKWHGACINAIRGKH